MVADFKPQAMNPGDFVPGQKVRLILHPLLGDKEGGAKSKLFEQRPHFFPAACVVAWFDFLSLSYDPC
jgi:hypothetical protein